MPAVHNVQSAPGELQHLVACGSRLCGISGQVAAIFSSDNAERPWTVPLDSGAAIVGVCFSFCGHFLLVGDASGVLSIVYLPCRRRVWSRPTSTNAALSQQKLLELHVSELGDLFVLFTGGVMLRFENMMLEKLHSCLSGVAPSSPEFSQIVEEFSAAGSARLMNLPGGAWTDLAIGPLRANRRQICVASEDRIAFWHEEQSKAVCEAVVTGPGAAIVMMALHNPVLLLVSQNGEVMALDSVEAFEKRRITLGQMICKACCLASDDGIDVCVLTDSKRILFRNVLPPVGRCSFSTSRDWELDLCMVASNPMAGLVCCAPPASPEYAHLEDQTEQKVVWLGAVVEGPVSEVAFIRPDEVVYPADAGSPHAEPRAAPLSSDGTLSQRRRQLEKMVEKSNQAVHPVYVDPARIMPLVNQLILVMPDVVIKQVILAVFDTPDHTNEVLIAVSAMLGKSEVPPSFDVAEGQKQIADTLARLATFHRLPTNRDGATAGSEHWTWSSSYKWTYSREAKLSEVCTALAKSCKITELFTVFGRHGAELEVKHILAILNALPDELEDEHRLPAWITRQVVPCLDNVNPLLKWIIQRAKMLERSTDRPEQAIKLMLSVLPTEQGSTTLRSEETVLAPQQTSFFPAQMVGDAESWAGLNIQFAPPDKAYARTRPTMWLFHNTLELLERSQYLQERHRLKLSLETLSSLSLHDMALRLLDRVGTALLADEVRVHLSGLCQLYDLRVDDVLTRYVKQLIENDVSRADHDSLGACLRRAIEVVACIGETDCRILCVIDLLRHCGRSVGEMPPELAQIVETLRSTKSKHSADLDNQMLFLDVLRRLHKYGVPGLINSEPVYMRRLVHHILALVEYGSQSLEDALALLDFAKMSVIDALFCRLCFVTDTAATKDTEAANWRCELGQDVDVTLSFCKDDAMLLSLSEMHMEYCWLALDQLTVTTNQQQDLSPKDKKHAKALVYAAIASSQASSSRLKSNTTTSDEVDDLEFERAGISVGFDVMMRLSKLHRDFDLYPSPDCISKDSAAAEKLFQTAGRDLIRKFMQGGSASACSFVRLLRFGGLMGLSPGCVRRFVAREAAANGSFDICLKVTSELQRSRSHNTVDEFLMLVHSMLAHFEKNALKSFRKPVVIPVYLAHLYHLLSFCLSLCAPEMITRILHSAQDLQIAFDLLLHSDLMDQYDSDISHAVDIRKATEVVHSSSIQRLVDGDNSGVSLPFLHQHFFREVPMLVTGTQALAAAFEFLRTSESRSDAKGVSQLPQVKNMSLMRVDLINILRNSECLSLALCIAQRNPWMSSIPEVEELTQEAIVKVIRAKDPLDGQLLLSLSGGVPIKRVLDLFKLGANHGRKLSNPQRLSRLARLGGVWKPWLREPKWQKFRSEFGLMCNMSRWCQFLSLIGIPLHYDEFARMCASQNANDNCSYQRSLLPPLFHATKFSLDTAVRFARDMGIGDQDVTVIWVKEYLLSPLFSSSSSSSSSSPPSSSSSSTTTGAAANLNATEMFDTEYRTRVPPVLDMLPPQIAAKSLIEVFPRLSPYDYDRIGFVVSRLCPELKRVHDILTTLLNHTRVTPPSPHELEGIRTWAMNCCKSVNVNAPTNNGNIMVDAERLARVAKTLAVRRLPLHTVTDSADPWGLIAPELKSEKALSDLLPLHQCLELDADAFRTELLHNLGPLQEFNEDDPCGPFCHIKEHLLAMQDRPKALELALDLERRLKNEEQLHMANCRKAVAKAWCDDEIEEKGAIAMASSAAGESTRHATLRAIEDHARLLQSKLDLRKAGLQLFESLLDQSPKICITALYIHIPPLLAWRSIHTIRSAAQLAIYKGLPDGDMTLQAIVDRICERHELDAQTLREGLIHKWLLDPKEAEGTGIAIPGLQELHQGFEALSAASALSNSSNEVFSNSDLSPSLFTRTAGDAICVQKVAFLCRRASTKEVKRNFNLLLSFAFSNEADVPYGAKCRALNVVFQLFTSEEIAQGYKHPTQDLMKIWHHYCYMECFQKLDIPQHSEKFYKCKKDGLARSLWRSGQSDTKIVTLVASLLLDFQITDSQFWAVVLPKLYALGAEHFLRDLLLALHDGLVLKLPFDEQLIASFKEIFHLPFRICSQLEKSGAVDLEEKLSSLGKWLPVLPYLLLRNPFVDHLDVAQLVEHVFKLKKGVSQFRES